MAVTLRQLKKWGVMLAGKSELHVAQQEGKNYSIFKVEGYYNDMTGKVFSWRYFDKSNIPLTESEEDGEKYHFPIAIFQYGLGAYDLYLLKGNQEYLEKAKDCADWAVRNQKDDGSWEMYPLKPGTVSCSAMAQGEGASLLIRAYIKLGRKEYYESARKAIEYMLLSKDEGGPTVYEDEDVMFLEYRDIPLILNGWIFALWGLYDLTKIIDDEKYKNLYVKSVQTMKKKLADFDLGFWSKYNIEKMIASPFYHRLHIAQMKAMYNLTSSAEFIKYADKWEKCQKSKINYFMAFLIKAFQKIRE